MDTARAAFFSSSASRHLVAAIETLLQHRFGAGTTERFPDGEVFVRLDEPVRGCEVILLASTAPPVNDHLVELFAMADACRRADAARIVAVIPYFGYARSDRRDGRRIPIMASLVANLVERAGVDQVVMVDVHTPAVEGFFRIPVDNVTAMPMLADALRSRGLERPVIVAPDFGAVRLANRYANSLGLPVAICHKRRLDGAAVSVSRVTGEVAGRHCIIVDDMISTGATIVESIRALTDAGALPNPTVAATHGLLVPGALDKLADVGVRALVVTDSIVPPDDTEEGDDDDAEARLAPTVVSIAPLLATAIRRLIEGGSLRELT